jgi:hypothetical protein
VRLRREDAPEHQFATTGFVVIERPEVLTELIEKDRLISALRLKSLAPVCNNRFSPPQNRLGGRCAFLSRDAASVAGLDVFETDRWPIPAVTSDTAGRSSLRVAVVSSVLFLILLDAVFFFFFFF